LLLASYWQWCGLCWLVGRSGHHGKLTELWMRSSQPAMPWPLTCPDPYGSQCCNVPRFICWLRHYIKCLLFYLSSPVTFFLACLLCYLSTSLRIGPFSFQAGYRKRRLNLALVFVLILCCHVLLCMHVSFGCIRFSFFICNVLVCIFVFFMLA